MSTTSQDYEKKKKEAEEEKKYVKVDLDDFFAMSPEEEEAEKKKEEEAAKKKKEEELKKADIILKTEDDKELAQKIEDAKKKGEEIGEKIGEQMERHADQQMQKKPVKVVKPEEKEPKPKEDVELPSEEEIDKSKQAATENLVDIDIEKTFEEGELVPKEPKPETVNENPVNNYHPEYKFKFDAKAQKEMIINLEKNDPKCKHFYNDYKLTLDNRISDIDRSMTVIEDIVKDELERHPEYFENPMMAQERVNIISAVVMDQNGLLPEGSVAQQMAKEHPAVGLSGVEKTLTDLHKNPQSGKMEVRIEDLFKNGFVVDDKGDMIPGGRRPWDRLDNANRMLAEGKTIYAKSRTDKVINIELDEPEVNMEGIHTPTMPLKESEAAKEMGRLVDPKVKKETIKQLGELEKILNETGVTRGDSEEFKNYKSAVTETKKSLETTAFKGDFNRQLDVLLETANEYYFAKADEGKNATRQMRVDTCSQLKQIVNAAKKDKVPTSEVIDTQDCIRRDIASKAVKTFAMANKDSEDSTKKEMSEHILSDAASFDKEVEKAMRDPAFVAMFGSKGNDIVDEAHLRKIAQQSGKDICKAVAGKNKELQEQGLAQRKEATKRQTQYAVGTKWREVSVPVKKASGDQIAQMKEKVEKLSLTFEGNPAFDKLQHEIEIANIRLQGGPKSAVHYKRMMAKIADAATDFEKSLLTKKPNKKNNDAYDLITQSKNLYEDVNANMLPMGNVKPLDAAQNRLADKLTLMSAEKLVKQDAKIYKDQGNLILNDNKVFEKTSKEIQGSKAFKALIEQALDPDDPKKSLENVEKLVNMKPDELQKAFDKSIMKTKGLGAKEFDDLNKNKVKEDKEKELEAVKKDENKSIAFSM